MVNTRIVLWEGKDQDVLNQTYNLAQVRFDWRFVIVNILSCFIFLISMYAITWTAIMYFLVSNVSLERILFLLYVTGLCYFVSADCSGNGAAVAVGDCGSRCFCSVRWTGTCCETRLPWRNWGDPHLETLDGRPVIDKEKLTCDIF